MGLPRPCADEISEEVTMLSKSSLETSPQFARISGCDYDESPRRQNDDGGNVKMVSYASSCARGLSCTADSDTGRRSACELPKCSQGSFSSKLAIDVTASMHGRRTGFDEKHIQCLSKVGQGISSPASRVVGFESPNDLTSHAAPKVTCEGFQIHTPVRIFEDHTDLPAPQIRKRTLSPLGDILSSRQSDTLNGCVEIEGRDLLAHSQRDTTNGSNEEHCRFEVHDYNKKANCGNSPTSMPLPIPRYCMWKHDSSRDCNQDCSVIHTDGPLLNDTEPLLHDHYFWSAAQKQPQKESNQKRPEGRAVVTKCSRSPPHLSLSPLGPRWADRMRVTCLGKSANGEAMEDVCSPRPRNVDNTPEECLANDASVLEDEIGMARKSFQEFGFFYKDFSPSTPHKFAGVGLRCCHESTSAPQTGIKLTRSLSGLPTRRSLVGSFEESLLSGRFSYGKASQKIDGFLAVLNVTGGSFSPPSRKLPFSVTCVDGDSSLLYYASVDLAGNSPPSKSKGTRTKKMGGSEDSRAAKSRFRIPVKGRIQLVLSNPEMTPVHTFMCSYDLSDMPPGTKTFMRHKVTLASSGLMPASKSEGDSSPTNFDSTKKCTSPSSAPVRNGCVQFGERSNDSDGIEKLCSLRSGKLNNLNLKDETPNVRACTYEEEPMQCDISKQTKGSDKANSFFFKPNNRCDVDKFTVNKLNVSRDLNPCQAQEIQKEDSSPMGICDRPGKKTVHNTAKVNDSTSGGGVLRYALHLRFLCPSLKKGSNPSQKCNSDSPLPSTVLNNSMQVEDQRRFYLYNDLRVVFPQRHSDADEGKLHVEYHFPADPKYFEYSN